MALSLLLVIIQKQNRKKGKQKMHELENVPSLQKLSSFALSSLALYRHKLKINTHAYIKLSVDCFTIFWTN